LITDPAELIARLQEDARATAKASQMIADAKSSRNQAHGDVDATYLGLKPKEILQWKAAEVLAAQAQEIEQMAEEAKERRAEWYAEKQRAEAAEARVRELKAEIDRLQTVVCSEQDRGDTIEAVTIERCAAIVGDHRVAARIRALAKEPLTPPPL
jgi:hypothetical protein